MRNETRKTPALSAVLSLQDQVEALTAERDDYCQKWLRQVDINDGLKGLAAAQASKIGKMEMMRG